MPNAAQSLAANMKVLSNHIYEFKKGVRKMVLFTCRQQCLLPAAQKLRENGIDFFSCPAEGGRNVNLFFGRPECIEAVKLIANRPISQLSPEEDFILGTLLGYDLCTECERYCKFKRRGCKQEAKPEKISEA